MGRLQLPLQRGSNLRGGGGLSRRRRQTDRLPAKGRVHSAGAEETVSNTWLDEEKCSSAQAPHAHGAALLDAHLKCSFNSLTEKEWYVS